MCYYHSIDPPSVWEWLPLKYFTLLWCQSWRFLVVGVKICVLVVRSRTPVRSYRSLYLDNIQVSVDTVRLGISVVLSESELAYVALYAVSLVAGRAIFVTLRPSIHGLHIRIDSEYSLAAGGIFDPVRLNCVRNLEVWLGFFLDEIQTIVSMSFLVIVGDTWVSV